MVGDARRDAELPGGRADADALAPGDLLHGDADASNTRFGANAGGGISIGIGRADLFFETRYTYVKRDEVEGSDQDAFAGRYIPVLVGFRFNGAPWRMGR